MISQRGSGQYQEIKSAHSSYEANYPEDPNNMMNQNEQLSHYQEEDEDQDSLNSHAMRGDNVNPNPRQTSNSMYSRADRENNIIG